MAIYLSSTIQAENIQHNLKQDDRVHARHANYIEKTSENNAKPHKTYKHTHTHIL